MIEVTKVTIIGKIKIENLDGLEELRNKLKELIENTEVRFLYKTINTEENGKDRETHL